MYYESLTPKIDKMFEDLLDKAAVIINDSNNLEQVGHEIVTVVASETSTRSKTMLSDMYSNISSRVLKSPKFSDVARQNKFYELNLYQELFEKYRFDVQNGDIDFKESNRLYDSLVASAGTATLGGILIFMLSSTSPVIPIAVVVAASIAVFCTTYYKITPTHNKDVFIKAVNNFLSYTKREYLLWFIEIEKYIINRVDDLKRTFNS